MTAPTVLSRPVTRRVVVLLSALLLLLSALVVVPATPGWAGAGGSTLTAGQTLRSGESLVTPGYRLVMQTDGNLVMYADGGRVRWHSWSFGNPGARVVMQSDGNLVVYSSSGYPLWHSQTWGNSQARLVLQGDGNLVVYRADSVPLWHIGSDQTGRVVDASGLYGIRGGVSHAPCGDPGALAVAMATSRTLYHGGSGWSGQIVASGADAPTLVRAWQASPPHVTVAAGTWSRMWAGAARGADGRMYGVVNFCR